MTGQFISISGRATFKREVQQSPNVANPAVAEAASSSPEVDAVDTDERFGLIGALIANHRRRQAMKHAQRPFQGIMPGIGGFGFPG